MYRPTAEVHNFSSTNPRELSFCKWLTKLCLWRFEHCTHDESTDPYPPSPTTQICSWATVELSWFSEYLVMSWLVSTKILCSACALSVTSKLWERQLKNLTSNSIFWNLCVSRYVISCNLDRDFGSWLYNCCIPPLSLCKNQIATSITRVLSVSILSGHTVSSQQLYYGESRDSYTQMTFYKTLRFVKLVSLAAW